MLDTIRVKYPISPTPEQLKSWTLNTTTTLTGERYVYIYNPVINETTLRFTYYPIAYNNKPLLALEFSLPKLLFDNNYIMLGNIDEAINKTNILLSEIPHAPKLDLSEGILIRLDMCYNHQVGESVNDYIKAISNLDYPHRNTKHHRYQGVEFRSKRKTLKFYNKEQESGFKEAHGILRQEITLISAKDIQKLLFNSKPTLIDITYEKVAEELKISLAQLGLLNNSIATRNTAIQTLSENEGDLAGCFYYGLLILKMEKSKKQICQESNMHPRSLDRKLRKIVDIGIPLTLTDLEEPLPPLIINYE